jgi:hypothetical protein
LSWSGFDKTKEEQTKLKIINKILKKTCVLFRHGCELLTPKVGVDGREEPKLFMANKAKHELGCTTVHG